MNQRRFAREYNLGLCEAVGLTPRKHHIRSPWWAVSESEDRSAPRSGELESRSLFLTTRVTGLIPAESRWVEVWRHAQLIHELIHRLTFIDFVRRPVSGSKFVILHMAVGKGDVHGVHVIPTVTKENAACRVRVKFLFHRLI